MTAERGTEGGRSVLPVLPPSGLSSIDNLLSPEQRERLTADLAEMARRRWAAEVEAMWIPMH